MTCLQTAFKLTLGSVGHQGMAATEDVHAVQQFLRLNKFLQALTLGAFLSLQDCCNIEEAD